MLDWLLSFFRSKPADAPPRPERPRPAPVQGAAALAARLKHRDADARAAAAERLGRLGPEAIEALPALLLAATDIDPAVRKTALPAAGAVCPDWPRHPLAI